MTHDSSNKRGTSPTVNKPDLLAFQIGEPEDQEEFDLFFRLWTNQAKTTIERAKCVSGYFWTKARITPAAGATGRPVAIAEKRGAFITSGRTANWSRTADRATAATKNDQGSG